jgi:hypothetical protein
MIYVKKLELIQVASMTRYPNRSHARLLFMHIDLIIIYVLMQRLDNCHSWYRNVNHKLKEPKNENKTEFIFNRNDVGIY